MRNINKYDVVVCSEVIEHVEFKESFIEACVKTLKPDGDLILTTINRNIISWLVFILLSEWIFGLLPRGTHNFSWFISPEESSGILTKYKCKIVNVRGWRYEFLLRRFRFQSYLGLGHAIHAIKESEKILKN